MKVPGIALLALGFAGCVSPTLYAPARGAGEGYSEQKIEEDRYRVTFVGNSDTPRETVETYLLYRAAELTLEKGYDAFLVAERRTEATTEYEVALAPPVYGVYHHGRGYRPFPYYAYGYPWCYEVRRPVSREYEATVHVLLRRGPAPDDPRAYDAHEVVQNLGPSIRRPDGE